MRMATGAPLLARHILQEEGKRQALSRLNDRKSSVDRAKNVSLA